MQCSLARSLEVVGDWWSPLVLRDLFLGLNRFDQLVDDLGISPHLLTAASTRSSPVAWPPRSRTRSTRSGTATASPKVVANWSRSCLRLRRGVTGGPPPRGSTGADLAPQLRRTEHRYRLLFRLRPGAERGGRNSRGRPTVGEPREAQCCYPPS